MEKEAAVNCWVFQSNPEVFRLRDALRWEALETFAVKAHKDKIKTGDRVILWQSGPDAGCYGLATVCTGPASIPAGEAERHFFRRQVEEDLRVRIRVDYNLWYKPLTIDLLPNSRVFQEFNAGIPGTNFTAQMEHYRQLVEVVERQDLLQEPEGDYLPLEDIGHPHNLILYGPPGTGKTYSAVNHALAVIENRPLDELALEDRQALRRRFDHYAELGQVALVTFHPSFAYEDFIEGLKPEVRDGKVEYLVKPGILKIMSERARQGLIEDLSGLGPGEAGEGGTEGSVSPAQIRQLLPGCRKYVLIVDEINRGNMAAVFGELITLLEPDKRAGMEEATRVMLPYSKTEFTLPPNLYLVGTMNTTDRSAEMLDAALRRRFAFRELRPDATLIRKMALQPQTVGVDLERLLQTINERIARLLDPAYCIGHGYFLNVTTLDDLRQVFAERILPLLQDYFFNDYARIGLILGRDFVRPAKERPSVDFAEFDYAPSFDPSEKQQFELVPLNDLDERAFIRIYDNLLPRGE